jgi:hypothetical protein
MNRTGTGAKKQTMRNVQIADYRFHINPPKKLVKQNAAANPLSRHKQHITNGWELQFMGRDVKEN